MRFAFEFESHAVTVPPDLDVDDVADEMDAHGVGSVIVVDDGRPIGIITDRDLVVRVIAPGRDPDKTHAEDVMTPDPLLIPRDTPTIELLKMLEERGVRRAPIVEDGKISGMISLDDLVLELGVQLWNVSEAVGSELRETRRAARGRRLREAREEALDDIWHQFQSAGEKVRKTLVRQLRDLAAKMED